MTLFEDWLLRHNFFPEPTRAQAEEDDSEHGRGGGVPSSWSDFHTPAEEGFKRLRYRHRFVPVTHQPPELDAHQFDYRRKLPVEREEAERSAYLKEMHRLGANPSFFGTYRQVVANATHDLNRRTNSPTSRPKPRAHAADIWYA